MFQSFRDLRESLAERLRTNAGRRAAAIALTLLLEGLLILLLLTLGRGIGGREDAGPILSTFDASDTEEAPEPEKPAPEPDSARPATQPQPVQQPDQPVPPQPAAAPAIIVPHQSNTTFDLSQVPRAPVNPAPARPAMGPPAPRASSRDSAIVGRRPNGDPVYAAQWYREPTHQEMAGYLSTAQGPGWGLIECQTVSNYRVENCEFVSEYPQGSFIARAALAAAWQFKVLPPRKGNQYLVGEWVRIRLILESGPAPAR